MWISIQKSTTDHIFCIRQIQEKKWEYNKAVPKFFNRLQESFGIRWVESLL